MRRPGRSGAALGALAVIVAVTASWWALALWPTDPLTPAWVERTRAVCFGSAGDGLPGASGWMLLIGQPIGMVAVLLAVWGADVRAALRSALRHVGGQLAIGATLAMVLVGVAAVGVRVRDARAEPFEGNPSAALAATLTRVNDAPPVFSLTDQAGATVSLDQFRGRPVIVAFAYAHCETVCPLVVSDVLRARDRLAVAAPAVLILTLDPWRDTPERLASIATQWGVTGDVHVLSGARPDVEQALNGWRIPRVRNEKTGDLSHPSMVYVVGRDGRITYVVNGTAEQIEAAVRAL